MMMQKDPRVEQFENFLKSQDKNVNLTLTIDKGSFDIVMSTIDSIKQSFNFKDRFLEMDNAAYALDQYAASTSRIFGTTREQMRGIKTIAADSFAQISMMGGTINDIQKGQEAITKSTNTSILATKQNITDLTLLNKTTGVASETLVDGFRKAGFSVTHIKDEMKTTVDYARSVGVNVTAVAEEVVKNIGKLNLFNFQNGSEGLAKMAAQSSMLGIGMNKTFDLAEKLLDPQKAIDLSASLQRLGVTSTQLLDPLRAMDLAQNDPTELQNQLVELSKQFVRTKEDGSFEILPGAKRQLREVADQLGLNANELAEMALNSSMLDKKLSEMRMPSFEMSEENRLLIANMAQFNKGTNQYEITYTRKDKEGKDETVTKVVSEIPPEDLQAIIQSSKPITLEELNNKQLSVQQQMLAQLELFNKSKVLGYAASEMAEEIIKGNLKIQQQTFKQFNDEMLKNNENIFRKQLDEKYQEKMKGKEIETPQDLVRMMKEALGEVLKNSASETGKVIQDAFGKGIGEVLVGLGILKEEEIVGLTTSFQALNNSLTETGGGVDNLTKAVDKLFGEIKKKMTETRDASGNVISSGAGLLDNIIDLNDFIVTKDGVYSYNQGDIMIGGTNLDGKNNNEIKENLTDMGNTKKQTPVVVNFDFQNLESVTKPMNEYMAKIDNMILNMTDNLVNKMSYSESPIRDNLSLTDFIKNNVNNNTEQIGAFSIENQSKEVFNNISTAFMGIKNELENLKNKNYVSNLDTNIQENVSPIYSIPSIPTATINIPTQQTLTPQRIEFGKIDISLSVDIPNLPNANVSTEQIKSVLEQTMNSPDFKQQLAIKINQASTNDGLTAQGGTANYGAQKTNYSLG